MSARLSRGLAGGLLPLLLAGCVQAGVSDQQAMALTHGGRAEVGRIWVRQAGCGGCHHVPGVPGARGRVGPPLDEVTERLFVAGVSPNHPDELISFLQDPQAVDSATAMPKTGLTRRQARDIAAYLYTLAR
jgi:cytochrome c2